MPDTDQGVCYCCLPCCGTVQKSLFATFTTCSGLDSNPVELLPQSWSASGALWEGVFNCGAQCEVTIQVECIQPTPRTSKPSWLIEVFRSGGIGNAPCNACDISDTLVMTGNCQGFELSWSGGFCDPCNCAAVIVIEITE